MARKTGVFESVWMKVAAAIAAVACLYWLVRRYVSSADRLTDKISDMIGSSGNDYAARIASAMKQRLLRHFSDTQSNVLIKLAVAQTKYETTNYTSAVFRNNNNICGYKYYEKSLYQIASGTMSPEGNKYGKYASIEDSARELADWLGRRESDFKSVSTSLEYAQALKKSGYYGETAVAYANGMKTYLV